MQLEPLHNTVDTQNVCLPLISCAVMKMEKHSQEKLKDDRNNWWAHVANILHINSMTGQAENLDNTIIHLVLF